MDCIAYVSYEHGLASRRLMTALQRLPYEG